jgi:hypothetical protein
VAEIPSKKKKYKRKDPRKKKGFESRPQFDLPGLLEFCVLRFPVTFPFSFCLGLVIAPAR